MPQFIYIPEHKSQLEISLYANYKYADTHMHRERREIYILQQEKNMYENPNQNVWNIFIIEKSTLVALLKK